MFEKNVVYKLTMHLPINFSFLCKILKTEEFARQMINNFNCTLVGNICIDNNNKNNNNNKDNINDDKIKRYECYSYCSENLPKKTLQVLKNLQLYFKLKDIKLKYLNSMITINGILLKAAVESNFISLDDYKLIQNTLINNNIDFYYIHEACIYSNNETDVIDFRQWLVDNDYLTVEAIEKYL